MAKLDFPAFQRHLAAFEFTRLFVDVLGWNNPPASASTWSAAEAGSHAYSSRMVAELGGVAVVQVVADEGWPDETLRHKVWRQISQQHAENLLIFTDQQAAAAQSQWYWVKRGRDEATGKSKLTPRRHDYFRGQPVDLFASKLQAMVVELSELDASGRLPVLEAARRIQTALDVEATTKRFFTRYSEQHTLLLALIEGIEDDRDRRWYASVILNRLMFVWFLQKKFFLDDGNTDYLLTKLAESRQRGPDRYFGEFLSALFFDAFAKPETERSATNRQLTGQVPYLNGGLFLHHKLELDAAHRPRLGTTLRIPDAAFEGIFEVFAAFTWHLDDTPAGNADEINPDVLGYIFEKYINQKAFGAYYTRPEITGYLAERSIHQLILERTHEPALPELGLPEVKFDSVSELLARMDSRTALRLVRDVLPSITVLDPAVGSGAFLVAALKCLMNVYYAVVGRAELGASAELQAWLQEIQAKHPSVGYYVKRCIVTDNLYGVDIMEEATEIAKLRLFLSMVASVRKVNDLEPLPNIDFNILAGNSLVGLMRVDEHEFDAKYKIDDMFRPNYHQLLEERRRGLKAYRNAADQLGASVHLQALREDLDNSMTQADAVMNNLLYDQFRERGIKFEQATWDMAKGKEGPVKGRAITLSDVSALHPMHWGYAFSDIIQERGGFDIILANPPWEALKPQAKEFFADYSELVTTNNMAIKDFEKEQAKLMKNKAVREAWLAYASRFPYQSAYFRSSPEYRWQSAVVSGKKTGSDVNLYKLFTERCFHLLRTGGHCGIVIPNSLYKDLGATGLRNMLFDHTQVHSMVSLSNERFIFEDVHHSTGILFLNFTKGGTTTDILATFRINPREAIKAEDFDSFVHDARNFVVLTTELVRALNIETRAILEFRGAADVEVAARMLQSPALGAKVEGSWNLKLGNEFHMSNDSELFELELGAGRLPLYEGKAMNQLTLAPDLIRYWIDEAAGRDTLLGRTEDSGQVLPYQRYRFAYRAIGRTSDSRTLIGTLLPPNSFYGHSLNAAIAPASAVLQAFLAGALSSMVVDYFLRLSVSSNLTMFFIYQTPLPRVSESSAECLRIARRVGKLFRGIPGFAGLLDALALPAANDEEVSATESAQLRAEIDGLVAHLYGLTELQFAHVLSTFPLVGDPAKTAARNAFRDVERGLIK
jgi:hypothetical protein